MGRTRPRVPDGLHDPDRARPDRPRRRPLGAHPGREAQSGGSDRRNLTGVSSEPVGGNPDGEPPTRAVASIPRERAGSAMAELGMVGNADFSDDLDEEVVEEKRSYSWHAPKWLPAALIGAVVLWGASISWMVAHIGGGSDSAEHAVGVSDEVAVLRAKVDSLSQQASALGADRDALAKRVLALESRPTLANTAPPPAAVATVMPSVFKPESAPAATATIPDATGYSIPRFAYWRTPDPTATAVTPVATGTTSRFFTSGADKYNCTSFASQAEAQEALAANAPGDPNRLDMNANGVACEDITYASGTARDVTPLTNR
ncbi:MAG: hypothetical protein EPO65_13245 [Dehalococcoidia bacterium]|nr:MAG: hypothetical protein EPO65_13245 [Dehalococcoidia bacterium]